MSGDALAAGGILRAKWPQQWQIVVTLEEFARLRDRPQGYLHVDRHRRWVTGDAIRATGDGMRLMRTRSAWRARDVFVRLALRAMRSLTRIMLQLIDGYRLNCFN